MSIYKSPEGKLKILSLYDQQLEQLSCAWKDLYVDTTFGKTHLIETGDPNGRPLLLFHGGNATTAYTLLSCDFLLNCFHIYGVDTIGHPGKSAEVSLSPQGFDYGKWASDVIDALGFSSICCFGGSFGAGILAKLMCVSPQKVERSVLCVPSGICNAPALCSISMLFPMILYRMTLKVSWFQKCLLPMALTAENITRDTLETARLSIDYAKVKAGMPSNVPENRMIKCQAPTLVLAAENDCLFPAAKVLPRAKRIIPYCKTYLLKNRGHMHFLTEPEKAMIRDFLLDR